MAIQSLGYVGIGVSDVARWEAFATGILGMQIGQRLDDGTVNLRMDERPFRIALQPGGNDDVAYLGWEVADSADLGRVAEALKSDGIGFSVEDAGACKARQVAGLLSCRDPAGIQTEFFCGAASTSHPFKSPRNISSFLTGNGGVGHVVLTVPDADAMMMFYHDVLGMRVSDFIEFTRIDTRVNMAFLHCNPRHHSLAFMKLDSAPRLLSHIMIEAETVDDVGRTYTLCEREGVPIAMGLGRHTNDEMFSFYIVSPSQFLVEFGWGARTIDDATWEIQRYNSTSIWGHARTTAATGQSSAAKPISPERIVQ